MLVERHRRFLQVIKNVVYKLQELQAGGKVHGHLTPAMVKVSDEGLVRVEGTHVIVLVPFARASLPAVKSSFLSSSLNHQAFPCGRLSDAACLFL